jgi:hypothetical protein
MDCLLAQPHIPPSSCLFRTACEERKGEERRGEERRGEERRGEERRGERKKDEANRLLFPSRISL